MIPVKYKIISIMLGAISIVMSIFLLGYNCGINKVQNQNNVKIFKNLSEVDKNRNIIDILKDRKIQQYESLINILTVKYDGSEKERKNAEKELNYRNRINGQLLRIIAESSSVPQIFNATARINESTTYYLPSDVAYLIQRERYNCELTKEQLKALIGYINDAVPEFNSSIDRINND